VLPFTPANSVRPFVIEGEPLPPDGAPVSDYRLVTPGYFAALGVPVIRGRAFTDSDTATAAGVVVVNEAFSARYLRGRDPLGRRLRQAGENPAIRWLTIVGVISNVRHAGFGSVPQPEMYWPHSQATWGDTLARLRRTLIVVVRGQGAPEALAPAVRARLRALDPQLAIGNIQQMEDLMADSAAPARFAALLMTSFAALALVLATAGVYGVVAFAVASRTREFGIRLALGAAPADLLRRILHTGLTLTAAGLAAGLGGAMLFANVLRTQLFEIPPQDPRTFASVAGVLLVAALAACVVPAMRAARLPATIALREE
jgi:putative ABC transport system permease protein